MGLKKDNVEQHNAAIDSQIQNSVSDKEKDILKSQKKEFNLLGELYSMRSAFGETYNLVAAVFRM